VEHDANAYLHKSLKKEVLTEEVLRTA